MDYEKALNYFNKFIHDNYDLNISKISHKLDHTYNVVECSKYICNCLNLSDEDKTLAMIIALLHDIGRFDQALKFNNIRQDVIKYDHAAKGVELLFEKNEIRNYVDSDKYDDIIKTAIKHHSDYILKEDGMQDKEMLHLKIIRDADKLDSFRIKLVSSIYTMANINEEDIENSKITDKVFNDFMNELTIFSKDRKTGIDIWISYIAMVFGLEFECSLRKVKENDYINKLFNRFEYKKDSKKMETLRNKALEYIENKLKK